MNKQTKFVKDGIIESAVLLWLLFNILSYILIFIVPKIREIISR